jgi:hypothetical protein
MRLAKMGHGLAQSSQTYRQFQFFGVVALWILGMHAISVQVFTRKNFGTRYMGVLNCLFGITAIGFYTGLGNIIISSAAHQAVSGLMEFLYTACICLMVYHRVVIWGKEKQGVIWHSMYSGQPTGSSLLAFTGFSEGTLKQWVEPLLLLILAYIASHAHQAAVATWLYIGAVSVFVHETLGAQIEKNRIYDEQDSMIESRYRNRAMAGKSTGANQGFTMAQSSIDLMRRIPDAEISGELPADVRNMMDAEEVAE